MTPLAWAPSVTAGAVPPPSCPQLPRALSSTVGSPLPTPFPAPWGRGPPAPRAGPPAERRKGAGRGLPVSHAAQAGRGLGTRQEVQVAASARSPLGRPGRAGEGRRPPGSAPHGVPAEPLGPARPVTPAPVPAPPDSGAHTRIRLLGALVATGPPHAGGFHGPERPGAPVWSPVTPQPPTQGLDKTRERIKDHKRKRTRLGDPWGTVPSSHRPCSCSKRRLCIGGDTFSQRRDSA